VEDHVTPGHISWYTYHGAAKGITSTTLANYDVSTTSYLLAHVRVLVKVSLGREITGSFHNLSDRNIRNCVHGSFAYAFKG
jgi:hypothetical protein